MVITRQLTDSASASTASDIQLGSCVTEIGQGAFSGYTNITDVEFPDSLTTIGVGAFSGSSITSVEFTSGVTTIGDNAFNRCSGLTELTIPSGVTNIGSNAFNRCSGITRINVEATTVPTLGADAFDNTNNCPIYVPFGAYDDYMSDSSWSEYYSRIVYEGQPYKLKFTSSQGIESFVKCDGSSATTKPSSIPNNISATTFGDCTVSINGFNGTSLGNITMYSSVTEISDRAFESASATSISFNNGLEEIGDNAFWNFVCSSNIILPNGINNIGNNAFSGCNSIQDVSLMDSQSIGESAFQGSSVQEVYLTNVHTIGNSSFAYCDSLQEVSLTNVQTIGDSAFAYCTSLTNCIIGSGVTSIGWSAFLGCSGLTSIVIPNSILNIGASAFFYCTNLRSITVNKTTPPTLGNGAFSLCPCVIYVPSASVELYKAAENWSDYANMIQAIPT